MKKVTVSFVMSLVMLALCVSASFAADPIIIRVPNPLADTHATSIALETVFKKVCEEKSGGRLSVEVYSNGQLGANDRQMIEGVSVGMFEMSICSASAFVNFDERFGFMDLPFLFKSREAAHKAYDLELKEPLNAMLAPHHIVLLSFPDGGFRHVTNNKRAVRTPEDMSGLKIRTMENPIHLASFKAFGANPTPMAFGELYTALQQGAVDGQENPIPIIYVMKFYEVQKYLSLTGHFYFVAPLFINKDFYEGLPEDLRAVVDDAAVQMRDSQRALLKEQEQSFLEKMKSGGIAVNELSPEEKQLFIDKSKGVYEDFIKKHGDELVKKATKYN